MMRANLFLSAFAVTLLLGLGCTNDETESTDRPVEIGAASASEAATEFINALDGEDWVKAADLVAPDERRVVSTNLLLGVRSGLEVLEVVRNPSRDPEALRADLEGVLTGRGVDPAILTALKSFDEWRKSPIHEKQDRIRLLEEHKDRLRALAETHLKNVENKDLLVDCFRLDRSIAEPVSVDGSIAKGKIMSAKDIAEIPEEDRISFGLGQDDQLVRTPTGMFFVTIQVGKTWFLRGLGL